ncbi:hypothetical protein GCM10009730_42060 [Streptomyces albidochromogenes]|uniref:DUF6907 domain-containing protein n=1 Tax=Streptomyces albidochromogenes TaxID=329524 RepID=UPI00110FC731|nr:hypothetical protein [Streptomyces albidochromogenes]
MSARTVTVATSDHGDVTMPEPSWCDGLHKTGGARSDLTHNGLPLEVAFNDGTVLAYGQLCQWPYSEGYRRPFITVELGGGEHEYDDADLLELQQKLATFAAVTIPELRVRLSAALVEARL